MTPEQWKSHAAKILWLRKAQRAGRWRAQYQIGLRDADEYFADPSVQPSRQRSGEPAAVDLVFEARRLRCRLPKGCWA